MYTAFTTATGNGARHVTWDANDVAPFASLEVGSSKELVFHHIDAKISKEGALREWRFIRVYIWLEEMNKYKTWELLADLHTVIQLP